MTRSAALDTNILIYAHVSDYQEHEMTRRWLSEFLSQCEIYYLSWQVVYEYIRILTHPKIHKRPLTATQAWGDLKPYLKDERCRVLIETTDHEPALEEIFKKLPSIKGNFIHDCHYAAILKEHAVKTIATFDSDFLKFQFLTVINPAVSA